jgi:hypothetical protein
MIVARNAGGIRRKLATIMKMGSATTQRYGCADAGGATDAASAAAKAAENR